MGCQAAKGEGSLCLEVLEDDFHSLSFKARLCLLAPPSPSPLPLRNITHHDSLVFGKLPASRSQRLQTHW